MRRETTQLYVNRVRNFVGMLRRGKALRERVPLVAEVLVTDDPLPFSERLSSPQAYRPISVGDVWGRAWQSAWFRLEGAVPASWAGGHVVAHLNVNGEALIFSESGCPLYSLTTQSVFEAHYGKDIYRLFEPCAGGELVCLWVEAAANQLFGINRHQHADRLAPGRHGDYTGRVQTLELCLFDPDLWHLWLDVEILADLYPLLPEHAPRQTTLLRTLNRAIDAYADDPDNAAAARAVLAPLYETASNPADLDVIAVGHAHIDTGWLWPVRETIRKSARTFASQLALLERYPDYVFGASQPQHYAFVKTHYPELYEKIRRAVQQGRWECQGAMWVEADCNLIGGESMIRQFVHGKNFFMDEFGVDVTNLWIPDVFGYSAAMPQIIRGAGVDTFLTQKISWSFHNEFPHNTFIWRGIDGSQVLTHFPPENTYNANLLPRQLGEAQNRFKENSFIREFISLFGIGDGGGGPKEEHIERGRRLRDLNGAPRVRFGTAASFFDRLKEHTDELPTWVGELYLELHRGTLTTQAETKKGNRKLELKLRETEFLCSLLPLKDYPRDVLEKTWKTLLINQFHDILPGSSIHMVYENTLAEYRQCMHTCEQLIQQTVTQAFAPRDDAVVLFNSLSIPYSAPVILPPHLAASAWRTTAGDAVPIQLEGNLPVASVHIPPHGFLTLRKTDDAPPQTVASTRERVLENARIRYEFAEDGRLTRAFDKEDRCEVLPEGEAGNLLSLYVDRPQNWDAWDVDIYYEDELIEYAHPKTAPEGFSGPVRKGLRFVLGIGRSRISQTVTLARDDKRLNFDTIIEWRESHRMLRVSFPTRIRTGEATCDIQYGYVRRPTHRNTSWDLAKFEVAAHRYIDLSDNDRGAALLNDCKYGHKIHDNVLDLNLLRAPSDPDPDADYGNHAFTYSFLPHNGTLIESDVQAQAAMLNQPPVILDRADATDVHLPVRVDGPGVSLEVLKKAEKEEAWIIRIVEMMGRHSSAAIRVNHPGMTLVETNLIEWTTGKEHADTETVTVKLSPFQIRTYKLVPR